MAKTPVDPNLVRVILERPDGSREDATYDQRQGRPWRIPKDGDLFDQSAVEDGVWVYRSAR